MIRLDDLQMFIRTAELGGLSAAARALDCSPAVASAALKRLEQQLGTRLFARSTRSLRLTPAGELFLPNAQQALAQLAEGRRLLKGDEEAVAGTLQLAAPSDFGRNLLLPWLDQLQQQHPALHVKLLLSDLVSDLFRQPVDLALRYGNPTDSSLIALPLASDNRRVLCAAPSYLQRHGTPQHPEELSAHNCLMFQLAGHANSQWRFNQGQQQCTVEVNGDRQSNDADVVRRWAVAGNGLAYNSWLDLAPDVLSGRLHVLLPDWLGEPAPLNLLCTHRNQLNKTSETLRQHLTQKCAELLRHAPWRTP